MNIENVRTKNHRKISSNCAIYFVYTFFLINIHPFWFGSLHKLTNTKDEFAKNSLEGSHVGHQLPYQYFDAYTSSFMH